MQKIQDDKIPKFLKKAVCPTQAHLPHPNPGSDWTGSFPACPLFPPDHSSAIPYPALIPRRLTPKDCTNAILCLLVSRWVQPAGATWETRGWEEREVEAFHSLLPPFSSPKSWQWLLSPRIQYLSRGLSPTPFGFYRAPLPFQA